MKLQLVYNIQSVLRVVYRIFEAFLNRFKLSILMIWNNHHPVSSVGRAPVCWARGGSWVQPRPDHQTRSLKNRWDHAGCETPFSDPIIASLGGDVKAVGPVSFILVLQLEGGVKEPVTLFEKSRGRRPRFRGLSDLCRCQSGWARCDRNIDWSGCKSAPLQADVRSHLSGSSAIQPLAASEERWHRSFFNFIFLFIC